MTTNPSIRVIKFGGSLLDAEDVFARIKLWTEAQPAMLNVWVIGGGQLVDALRDLHQRFKLNERDSHWLAVDLLDVTAEIVGAQFPDWPIHRSMPSLRQPCIGKEPGNRIFACGDWLRSQPNVPETWEVTTDSIAAIVARELNAEELVLLKSASAQPLNCEFSEAISHLSQAGFVDAWFPDAVEGVKKLRLVNLRNEKSPELFFRQIG